MKVFRRYAVIRAVDPALEHRPERLHAVRVSHAADVFADAVVHRFVADAVEQIGDVVIRGRTIGVERRAVCDRVFDEIPQGFAVCRCDNPRLDLAGLAILRSDNGGFARSAAPRVELLGLLLVAFLAAEV